MSRKVTPKVFEALLLFVLVMLVSVRRHFQQYPRQRVNMYVSSYNGLEGVELEINEAKCLARVSFKIQRIPVKNVKNCLLTQYRLISNIGTLKNNFRAGGRLKIETKITLGF